ncbi:catalase [Diaphorobacter ruginosibacter]|uniref:catalase n=1 Tax=Diaphorobacter ruginosibacter TaxID=1715720 RepID=A0A7G9RVJ9_9BURK|nr:catalase [Diaphorobacter ruginosibacter]
MDSSGRVLTTNQGVAVADNQNSLKYGERGPALLEDFILREKITHFDHERIPERIVHARGSGAHGYFECYESLADLTRAAPFQEAGKITPVFVRFSTVQGERGSKDTARDAWITPVTSLLISQRQMRTQCRFRLVSDFRG